MSKQAEGTSSEGSASQIQFADTRHSGRHLRTGGVMMMHFGEHVTYDGYGCEPQLLDSESAVSDALTDLVAELGMTRLGGPEIYSASANAAKDPGGWTGVVVLQESHISVHTFPARAFLSADVYTCQNGLDVEKIQSFFRSRFRAASDEVQFLKRGTRYPSDDLHPERVRRSELSGTKPVS